MVDDFVFFELPVDLKKIGRTESTILFYFST